MSVSVLTEKPVEVLLTMPGWVFILLPFFMARQSGKYRITGRSGGLCFYEMEGKHYVRQVSSLTGKRFWKDAAFAGSRRSCMRMKDASVLASKLYRQLPDEMRKGRLFQRIVGEVKKQIKAGKAVEEIVLWFVEAYMPVQEVAPLVDREKTSSKFNRPQSIEPRLESRLFIIWAPPDWAGRVERRRRRLRAVHGPPS